MKTAFRSAFALFLLVAVTGLAAAETRQEGSFTRQDFKISGSWSIVEENGKLFVELSDDFKTKSAPDLKVFFSPKSLDALSGKNVTSDGVLVAPLRSAKGGQRLPVPDGVDPAAFESIVIHCEKYSKLWGGASL